MDPDRITVMIADDQAMVRRGFSLIVDHEVDLEVISEAADGQQAVAVAHETRPDVVLMDIRMPGLDGIAATRQLRADPQLAATQVIVLTTFGDDEYVVGALRAGASGFLLKDVTPQVLVDAIRRVHGGDSLLDPSVTRAVIERFRSPAPDDAAPSPHPSADARPESSDASRALARLSAREGEVWRALAAGLSNREIGKNLGITEATVKAHVTSLLVKLGVTSRVQAVILAYDVGLVAPDR